MENQIPDNQEQFQKKGKSIDEMVTCKSTNSNCHASLQTRYLTGGEAGSIGSGEHQAPEMNCILCNSKSTCWSKVTRSGPGWY